ncbi:hypothetical protein PPROV_000927000 [Pycnococcus provasolii]|uniref:JmjC domain-containing protein n=1 Tax=Pycnococcus provasolii TaxID=41880 RepID=A0A830I0F4_9CHLO|nr:hypothetical protein PPROV_000927000 [Pycnococcus provasolii]
MSVASLLLQARRGAPAADLPLLLSENVPLLKSWAHAFNSASFDFIASSSQVINLKLARKPTASFMYEEHGNANLSEDVMSDAFHTEAFACAPHEVLAMCKQPPAGTSVYYTQEVSKDVLDERTPGWQDLASGAVNNKPIRCSVWMSSQGANTHAHYDAFDNVIVQLYGKKRVTLWPPREHWHLRVFPDAHPRARKSRLVEPAGPSGPTPWQVVELEPGSAIRIPALWFHHVENVGADAAVSLNCFSDSTLREASSRAFSAASACSANFASAMDGALATSPSLREAVGATDFRELCARMLWSRYASLSDSYEPVRGSAREETPVVSEAGDESHQLRTALERVHSLSGEYGAASVVCAHMAELACVVASSSSSSSSPNQGASDVRAWLRKHAE